KHLTEAIEGFSKVDPKKADAVREALKIATKDLAVLHIVVNVDHVPVWIDAEHDLAGVSPIRGDVFIAPGRHTLFAEIDEYDPVRMEIVVEKGQPREVSLDLQPSKRMPPVDTAVRPLAPPEARDRSVVPLVVGGGLAAIGIGVGVGFAVHASRRQSDAGALSA